MQLQPDPSCSIPNRVKLRAEINVPAHYGFSRCRLLHSSISRTRTYLLTRHALPVAGVHAPGTQHNYFAQHGPHCTYSYLTHQSVLVYITYIHVTTYFLQYIAGLTQLLSSLNALNSYYVTIGPITAAGNLQLLNRFILGYHVWRAALKNPWRRPWLLYTKRIKFTIFKLPTLIGMFSRFSKRRKSEIFQCRI